MILLIKKNIISENNNIDIASQKIENDIIYNFNPLIIFILLID